MEAQESSPTPETQSAEPTAYRQAQAVKPANPKADRALIDAVRKGSKETVNIEPVKQAIAAGADLNAKMQSALQRSSGEEFLGDAGPPSRSSPLPACRDR